MAIFDGYNFNREPLSIELDLMDILLQRDMSVPIKQSDRNDKISWIDIYLTPNPFDEKLREINAFSYDALQPILSVIDGQVYIQINFSKDNNRSEFEFGNIVRRDEYEKMANFVHESLSTTELKDFNFYDTYEQCVKFNLRYILHNGHSDLNDRMIDYLTEKVYKSFIVNHPDSFSDDDIYGDEVNKRVSNILEDLADTVSKDGV